MANSSKADFLAGGGELADAIAAFDWAKTPLGPIEGWPASIKTTVALMLRSPVPLVSLWGELGIMIYNDAYARFAGARHPKLLGSEVRKGWPEVADFNDNIMKVVLGRGETLSYRDFDLVLYRRGSTEPDHVWFNLDYSPVLDETGKPIAVLAIVVEITEAHYADIELKENQQRLSLAMEAAGQGAWTLDLATMTLQASTTCKANFGRGKDDAFTYADLIESVAPKDRLRMRDAVQSSIENKTDYDIDYRVIWPDGQTRWVHIRGRAQYEADGKPARMFGVSTDITERKQREQELRDYESRYRILFNAMDEGFCIIQFIDSPHGPLSDYVHIEANAAYAKHAGIPNVVGQKVREMVPDEADGWVKLYGDVLRTGKQIRFERELVATGRYLELAAFRIEPASLNQVAVLFQDITARKRAEIKNRDNQERLEFLDRLNKETANSVEADAILAVTTRMVGEHLGVALCTYSDMDEGQDNYTVRGDWAAPGAKHIVGRYKLSDFGKRANETLRAGKPLIINDNLKELPPEESAPFQNLGIGATICIPLVKEGRLTALMAIHHKAPHVWTENELALILEVTERSWAHIERVRSEAEIRENRERLELALAAGSGIGIWDWDVVNDRVYADARFAALYNVDPELAKEGAPITKFFGGIHPDDTARVQSEIASALKTGEPFVSEYRLLPPNGRVRWVVARGRCTLAPDGRPMRFPGATFEITERKVAEARLRELNTDLERQVVERSSERGTTWNVSPHLLSVLGLKDGRFARVNPAWQVTLGWTEAEMVGFSFMDFLHPEDIDASQAAFEKVMNGIPVFDFENRYRAKDGSYHWLSWVAVPEDGRLYSTAREITEEKEKAVALAAAEESLRQAQKMEAVGQLTGGLAHDFNNLLAGISGSLELMSARISQGRVKEIDRYVNAAQGAARRAAALTHRLLAFSRRQTLAPKATNVNQLVTSMEDIVRRSIGPSIAFEVVGASGLWTTLVDPPQLESALLNLCINARDAMPDGGRITVETANKWMDERAAREHDMPQGQYVSLCVTDTGTGMPPEIVKRVFEPFYTTKPLGQGTGLGLSMIYGFARQSGGQIRIYSEVGKGTTVCIYLPRHYGASETEEVPVQTLPSTGKTGGTVLVVDDEPTVRMLVTDILDELGYTAIEAPDSAAGLTILQSNVPIDLLVTDVGLPGGMNGRQMADAARVRRPDLKVLFITGYAENAILGNGQLEPDMDILTKPFSVDVMSARIREMISKKVKPKA